GEEAGVGGDNLRTAVGVAEGLISVAWWDEFSQRWWRFGCWWWQVMVVHVGWVRGVVSCGTSLAGWLGLMSLGVAVVDVVGGGYKRSVFSSFGHSRGSTRMATRLDSYHSGGVNLNISLTTVKQTIETTECQTLCNTGQLKPGDYSLFKPKDFRSTRNSAIKKIEDEDDYLLPSLSFGTRLQ
ncbi:hypothetical protein Tco_1084558, partial [Tanacetum coccineum]